MRRLLTLLACASLILNSPFAILHSQRLPQGLFRNPLDVDVALSATFGEVRSNHFHAGIDMRTGGKEGLTVRAVADGYVSAVRVSPWGGGKMLYITHRDGYMSVYMHLSAYEGAIGQAVLAEQYRTLQYAIYKEFAPGELPVRQGQAVARSGNTGGSAGPHLHFELRKGDVTINPLLFGMPYRDGISPTIRGVRLYPVGGAPQAVSNGATVQVDRPFYLGIYATDAAEGSTARNGFDRIEVTVDGTLFFQCNTEQFALDSSRMVNAIIDYAHYQATRQGYIITRRLPGAEGPWVPVRQGDGIVRLGAGRHRVTVKVYDIRENSAEWSFTAIGSATASTDHSVPAATEGETVHYDKPFSLTTSAFALRMKPYTLYADDRLKVEAEMGSLSTRLTISPTVNALPPDRWYTLTLRGYTVSDRAVVVRTDGRQPVAYSTKEKNGWYTARVRDFGVFELMLDTLAPAVTPVSLKGTRLRVKVSDDLSGVDSYHCYLNGSWILAEYDGKTATLVIDAVGKLRKGKNELRVEVADMCGNLTRRSYEF